MTSTPSRPTLVQEAILADLAARRGYLAKQMSSTQAQIDWVRTQEEYYASPEAIGIIDKLEAEMASLLDRDEEASSLEANIRGFYGS